jgi:glycosyltransferase involved in cell wall biosynthesis
MPRIVYLSWPVREISGGIKVAFQHVEMLNEGGIDAVVASAEGDRPVWFATQAPVTRFDAIGDGDILVFPENNAQFLEMFASRRQPKVVFCQNPFLVHQGLGIRSSYADYGVSCILGPSHSVLQFCAERFPGMQLGYTPFSIDHSRFVFSAQKTLQIVTAPRKRMVEFGAIMDLLRACHPDLRDVPCVYMHGATETQVAEAMARSAVFLSLSRLEAHAMTPLEAMASGCIVAGFKGIAGGTDSATLRNGLWAPEDDVPGCVAQLARALRLARQGGVAYRAMVEEGLRTAHDYRREEAARRLLEFWRPVLAQM